MSYLMYPQVFMDYVKRFQKKSTILTLLPTPVYLYALNAGDVFDMNFIQTSQLGEVLAGDGWKSVVSSDGRYHLRMELQRVSPINHQHRVVSSKLSLLSLDYACIYTESQQVSVKDTGGVFVFEGPMADPKKPTDQVRAFIGDIQYEHEIYLHSFFHADWQPHGWYRRESHGEGWGRGQGRLRACYGVSHENGGKYLFVCQQPPSLFSNREHHRSRSPLPEMAWLRKCLCPVLDIG